MIANFFSSCHQVQQVQMLHEHNDNRTAGMGDLASPGGFWIPSNYGERNNTHAVLEYSNIYSSTLLTRINTTAYEDIDNSSQIDPAD
uniref:Uncharacterized protein n=1 Tax=Globodera rostochiensis TaxID=31243 RepID=A0A914GPB6_GLORO